VSWTIFGGAWPPLLNHPDEIGFLERQLRNATNPFAGARQSIKPARWEIDFFAESNLFAFKVGRRYVDVQHGQAEP
jgi:hypothetical protein